MLITIRRRCDIAELQHRVRGANGYEQMNTHAEARGVSFLAFPDVDLAIGDFLR